MPLLNQSREAVSHHAKTYCICVELCFFSGSLALHHDENINNSVSERHLGNLGRSCHIDDH